MTNGLHQQRLEALFAAIQFGAPMPMPIPNLGCADFNALVVAGKRLETTRLPLLRATVSNQSRAMPHCLLSQLEPKKRRDAALRNRQSI